jgi:N-acetylglutamate synthase-like GNAT family acetyltransferase
MDAETCFGCPGTGSDYSRQASRARDANKLALPSTRSTSMIRPCADTEFDTIYEIINDAAQAYRGVIPADRWKEPYMPKEELRHALDEGIVFWGYEEDGELIGVMGIQPVQDVTLIRHAYVRTAEQNRGVGGKLLAHLRTQTDRPVLIGTWADAVWAIRFYEKHGFRLVSREEKERLLRRYWSIPERQVATSVVLADQTWMDAWTNERMDE